VVCHALNSARSRAEVMTRNKLSISSKVRYFEGSFGLRFIRRPHSNLPIRAVREVSEFSKLAVN
jgi:hypothetical protein